MFQCYGLIFFLYLFMTHSFKISKYVPVPRVGLLAVVALLIQACTGGGRQAPGGQEYYSKDDFKEVVKTDVHIHIFTERDDFMEVASDMNFRVVNVALDIRNNLASVRSKFRFGEAQQKNHPSSVETVTAFSMEGWDDPGWLDTNLAWLDSCIDRGAIAVKIWKNIGMVFRDKDNKLIMIDNPRFDSIFKMLADRKVPVLGHLGEPKNCWLPLEEMTTNNDRNYFGRHPEYHMYRHPDFPSYEDQIAARDRMLEKNPSLVFVGAHMGSLEWSVDELAKHFDRFPNMAVDLAARMGQVFYQTAHDREKVRDFFIKYQDRLLYATDMGAEEDDTKADLEKKLGSTWMRDWEFFVTDDTLTSNLVNEPYRGLKLPREVVDKIYNGNARKWLGAFDQGTNGPDSAEPQ